MSQDEIKKGPGGGTPSEKGLPRVKVGTKKMVRYNPGLALQICESIAEGKTVSEICATDWAPSRQTIYRWLASYPDFAKAYERAYEISAEALEEEALGLARELKKQEAFTGTRVQAYNVAMQQLRWSAARRNPTKFGSKVENNVVVPVQINTNLDLGRGSLQSTDRMSNIYSMKAVVKAEREDNTTPEEDLEVFDGEGAEVYNVPADPDIKLSKPSNMQKGTPRPRQGKKHKSYRATRATEGQNGRRSK